MKRALVVGLGVSGRAARDLLLRKGYEVVGVDDRMPYSVDPADFDEVIVSPGIRPDHPLYGQRAIGEMALACRYLDGPAVGITGTNGKTTVTLMVAHVLNGCGIAAKAVGNVGNALSNEVERLGEAVAVVELSSYQLETMGRAVFDMGLVLNIGEDHLDRYPSVGDYAAAKLRLERVVRGPFWVNREVKSRYSLEQALVYDDPIERILSAAYKGIDCSNAHAAYVLCSRFGIGLDRFVAALATFQRPPHRMEWVAEIGGVPFVNDSKGTNPDAVVAAVEQIEGPIWLIAGGQNKGLSFEKWRAFEGKVERLLLIGEASVQIGEAMRDVTLVEECGTLSRAVDRCRGATGTVLLSPGCASFDQFADYAARGETFRELVRGL